MNAKRNVGAARLVVGAMLVSGALGGCLEILGHKERKLDPTLGAGGEGGTAGEGGTGATGGMGGTGGTGGAMACEPGTQAACYEGPPDTQDVGLCKSGMQTCSEDGSGFGACEGAVLPAAESCKGTEDEDCNGVDCVIWSRAFGEDQPLKTVVSIVPAPDGGMFLYGIFDGTLAFGATTLISSGGADLFLAKLDPQGEPEWAKQFGAAGLQLAEAAAVDGAGNVVIAGMFAGDVSFGGETLSGSSSGLGLPATAFAAKFDAMGTHLWSSAYAANVADVAIDQSGAAVLVGSFLYVDVDFDGISLTNNGESDVFVAKLGSTHGKAVWAKAFGGLSNEQATAVAVDPAGNIAVAGIFEGTFSVVGNALTTAGAPGDVFVIRLDAQGAPIWAREIEGGGMETVNALQADSTGSFYVAGVFDGSLNLGGTVLPTKGVEDAYVVKLSSVGDVEWGAQYGSTQDELNPAIYVGPSGDLVLGVSSSGKLNLGGEALTSAGEHDVFVGKFTSGGAHVWSRRFGDAADQFVTNVAVGTSGEVLVASRFYGTLDFGNGGLVSDDGDIAVAKLAP